RMAEGKTDLLRGTLDMLILKTLSLQPLHGLGVSQRIEQVTGGVFQVKPGSLFPALHRLEQEGWIEGSWGESANNRRAKYYELTSAGRRRLGAEKRNWAQVVLAITKVLEAT
ncbi:MAG: PadR family transcriptional regulator, partial [Gemmatimonadales bacterium]